ncbi:unnamed protein product [Allacma fusca]|uniref:Urocanate hydratase n=1 Tax=Allacma fusca TaxID=39272 RepID=A0A8J2KSN8_9HEXA|nr:unnamed protein product [Allacma fusca]
MKHLEFLQDLKEGIPLNPLPSNNRVRNPKFSHAPRRRVPLTPTERELAIQNALRYFPRKFHSILEEDFNYELDKYGHIYMYRFLPKFNMKAYPIDAYPAQTQDARAIMLMICNNLDPNVAQFPEELIVYGGNGQVFSNWGQFWLVMKYLSHMDETQTLSLYSGHPLGLFPSLSTSPRVVITNGMVIPNYSSPLDYDKFFALGVTMYGQMTAGSYSYIGPQGIVHGTTIVLMSEGRKHLKANTLEGKIFVSAGLGGMSGAQAKAAVIAGCVGIIAEISYDVLKKRYDQGWVKEIFTDLGLLLGRMKEAKANKDRTSIAYHGNIVDLWESLVEDYKRTGERLVDLGSDQTSLHIPFNGGYFPASLTYEESREMISSDPARFKELVQISLNRQVNAINTLTKETGMHFWDYGNAFLLESKRAGAPITKPDNPEEFIYPSYVEDIMGDIFSLGFGPFRWVCCSGLEADLRKCDAAAAEILEELANDDSLDDEVRFHYRENLKWILEAGAHNLVVGSQARILYSDCIGRTRIAQTLDKLVASGDLKGPVVISRDHHDVSGTDSPFRETANITDGSKFTADMAVQNFIGLGLRGATWVSLHNGGGVGWGEVINGNFGLVLDGTRSDVAANVLLWDVNNGIARRAWAGNENALRTIKYAMKLDPKLEISLPF